MTARSAAEQFKAGSQHGNWLCSPVTSMPAPRRKSTRDFFWRRVGLAASVDPAAVADSESTERRLTYVKWPS